MEFALKSGSARQAEPIGKVSRQGDSAITMNKVQEPQGVRKRAMGKDKAAAGEGWWPILLELLRFDLYKRSQGKIVRQVTGFTVALAFALAAWRLHQYLLAMVQVPGLAYGLPVVVLLAGLWFSYRLVNVPTFADFLIAVEAEMNKVSWPSRLELVRASIVVIVLMFGLTLVLYGYDVALSWLLKSLGIIII